MIFADLKMVKQINKKYHWAMESQPEIFEGLTTIMSGDFPMKSEATWLLCSIKLS